jgi:hypothetical protein
MNRVAYLLLGLLYIEVAVYELVTQRPVRGPYVFGLIQVVLLIFLLSAAGYYFLCKSARGIADPGKYSDTLFHRFRRALHGFQNSMKSRRQRSQEPDENPPPARGGAPQQDKKNQ